MIVIFCLSLLKISNLKFYNQLRINKLNINRVLFFLFSFCSIVFNCNSQTNTDIKNNKLQYTIDKGVLLEVINCEGEAFSNTVKINFRVTNSSSDTNRLFISDFGYAKANNQFKCLKFSLANDTDNGATLLNAYLSPNQSVMGSFSYEGISTNLKLLSSVSFLVYNNKFINGQESKSVLDSVVLNNINIDWAYRLYTPKAYKNLISVGVGFKSLYMNSNYSASSPINATLSYQRKLFSSFSVGVNISIASYKYNYDIYYGTYSPFNSDVIYCGLNANYILTDLINEMDLGTKLIPNFEPYIGVSLGIESVYKDKIITNVPTPNQDVYYSATGGLREGIYIGVRYSPIKNVFLYGELGNNTLSLLNLGAAFRFN